MPDSGTGLREEARQNEPHTDGLVLYEIACKIARLGYDPHVGSAINSSKTGEASERTARSGRSALHA